MVLLHIGIDDTDSPRMGCTTYIAALLTEKLTVCGAEFIDYPRLIRLNPNVPWKTRGNGAVALSISCPKDKIDRIKRVVLEVVEKNSDLEYPRTDPSVVFLEGNVPNDLTLFAKMAITGVVEKKLAFKLAEKYNAETHFFDGDRGVIGGLAAIGETLLNDHTFELLAYRTPENRGSLRRVDENSVFEMDKATYPETFNNIDYERRRVLITPRGPDPVLWGVRGESPEAVRKAHNLLISHEPIERWVIFVTNQATDDHLKYKSSISEVKPHHPVILEGEVSANPKMITGRHVIFQLKDETGVIDCAAYEPTGILRKVAGRLIVGDSVRVMGSVRPSSIDRPLTINLEKMEILELKPKVLYVNPVCPKCNSRMESMGKGKGYRCRKCNFKSREATKERILMSRDLKPGLYISPPRSQRHLTKPFVRYGREKRTRNLKMVDCWHQP